MIFEVPKCATTPVIFETVRLCMAELLENSRGRELNGHQYLRESEENVPAPKELDNF